MVRPYHNVLLMSMLRHCDERRKPDDFAVTIPAAKDKNVRLAEQLVESESEDEFDFAEHGDPYKARLRQLIESKIEGKEIAMPPAEEAPEVINLADALKKSIARPHGSPKQRRAAKRPSGRSSKHRRRAS